MGDYSDDEAIHLAEAFKALTPAAGPEEQADWLARPSGVAGGTNLHEAAKYGTLKFADLEALTAAMLAAADEAERTPVHYAALNGELPLLQNRLTRLHLLAEDRWRKTPTTLAVEAGQFDQLKVLLKAGLLPGPALRFLKPCPPQPPNPKKTNL